MKNAQMAGHDRIKVPFSNFDMAVAEFLVANGFAESVHKKGRLPKRIIEINLKTGTGVGVQGVIFLSTSSRRVYRGYQDLKKERSTRGGIVAVSTPLGVMRVRDAIKKKVGGELLFEVW